MTKDGLLGGSITEVSDDNDDDGSDSSSTSSEADAAESAEEDTSDDDDCDVTATGGDASFGNELEEEDDDDVIDASVVLEVDVDTTSGYREKVKDEGYCKSESNDLEQKPCSKTQWNKNKRGNDHNSQANKFGKGPPGKGKGNWSNNKNQNWNKGKSNTGTNNNFSKGPNNPDNKNKGKGGNRDAQNGNSVSFLDPVANRDGASSWKNPKQNHVGHQNANQKNNNSSNSTSNFNQNKRGGGNNNNQNKKGDGNNNNHHHQNKKGDGNNNNNNNNKKKSGNQEEKGRNYIKDATILLQQFMNKKDRPEPVDSFVLKLHYRMSVFIFLIAFTIVQSNWYLRETIACVSSSNGKYSKGEIPFHLKNFCLSFSYICDPSVSSGDECHRRYFLFYRWLSTSFLLVSLLYYIPRFVAKKFINPRLKNLLFDLSCHESRYDDSTFESDTEKMLKFMQSERSTKSQYLGLVLCHIIALSIDCTVAYFFDFMLHNRFLGLMYYSYPYHRMPPHFTDYLSQTFPPFANCTVHIENLINLSMEETFGCYLYLMELYDKLFVFVWLWLVFLITVTILSIFILLVLPLPLFNRLFLHLFSSSVGIREIKKKVYKISNLGDLYALHLMRQRMSEGQFIRFLGRFVHSQEDSLEEVAVDGIPTAVGDVRKSQNVLDTQWNTGKEEWVHKGQPQPFIASAPQYPCTAQIKLRPPLAASLQQ